MREWRLSRTKWRRAYPKGLGWEGDGTSVLRIMEMEQLVRFLFLPSLAKALLSFSRLAKSVLGLHTKLVLE